MTLKFKGSIAAWMPQRRTWLQNSLPCLHTMGPNSFFKKVHLFKALLFHEIFSHRALNVL